MNRSDFEANVARTRYYLRIFSTALAGLSVFALMHHAFSFGLASAFGVMLGWYDSLLGVMLEWVEPIVDLVLRPLPFELRFDNPDWRHIFVFSVISVTHTWRLASEISKASPEYARFYWLSAVRFSLYQFFITILAGVLPKSTGNDAGFWVFMLFLFPCMYLLSGWIGRHYPNFFSEQMYSDPSVISGNLNIGKRMAQIFVFAFLLVLASAGLSLLGL